MKRRKIYYSAASVESQISAENARILGILLCEKSLHSRLRTSPRSSLCCE